VELNSKTIGSYRTFQAATRKAMYWKLADALLIVWGCAALAALPFAAGAVFVGH
jgi:hypothetical protein